jgi:hypothetical protein
VLAGLSDLGRDLDAGAAGKILIEQQAVELLLLDLGERLVRVRGFFDGRIEPALFDGSADRQPVDQIVIDYEET